MLDKLEKIAQRLAQVERQLSDPAVYSDRAAMTKLSREQKELTPVVEAYRAYARAEADMAAATEMLSDPELKELGQEELAAAKAERERLEDELKRLLLPRDPNDDKDVVLEIRAGIGGEEGALFAADLLRMYSMYAERRGFTLDVVSLNETELGGVKEAVATVEGAGAYSRLKFEAGTHRVQRVPETESSGRIQTSAATVAVMPEAEEVDVTTLDSTGGYREYMQGWRDAGTIAVNGFFDSGNAGQTALRTAFDNGKAGAFEVSFADGSKAAFSAFVKKYAIGAAEVDGAVGFSAQLRVSGAVTFTAGA